LGESPVQVSQLGESPVQVSQLGESPVQVSQLVEPRIGVSQLAEPPVQVLLRRIGPNEGRWSIPLFYPILEDHAPVADRFWGVLRGTFDASPAFLPRVGRAFMSMDIYSLTGGRHVTFEWRKLLGKDTESNAHGYVAPFSFTPKQRPALQMS
jgi:hypothetical protein